MHVKGEAKRTTKTGNASNSDWLKTIRLRVKIMVRAKVAKTLILTITESEQKIIALCETSVYKVLITKR